VVVKPEPQFTWDADKNRANIRKHGQSFEQAGLIFENPVLDLVEDWIKGEWRTLSIGRTGDIAMLAVAHTDRDGIIRIISARRATKQERKAYDQYLETL